MKRKRVKWVDLEKVLFETLSVYDEYSDGLQKEKVRIFVVEVLKKLKRSQTFDEAMIEYKNKTSRNYVTFPRNMV